MMEEVRVLETNDVYYDEATGRYIKVEGKKDNVNHPSHYESSCSLECIDVMEAVFGDISVYDFCICNAFKYLWRYKHKNGEEDIRKAEWYINRARKLSSEMDMFSDEIPEVVKRMEKLLDQVREKEKGIKEDDK